MEWRRAQVARRRRGAASIGGAAVLLAASAVAARAFRTTAVHDFRLDWPTWGVAVSLAFAAGSLLRAGVRRPIPRWVAALAALGSAAALVHLPAVLTGVAAWGGVPGFATTTVLDRTGPQLAAAAVAGAAVTALIDPRRGPGPRRGDRGGRRATAATPGSPDR